MKVLITPTKIKVNGAQTITLPGVDEWLDLYNGRIFREGTVVAIEDMTTGTIWTTDFAYASAAAILAAAPNSGGYHALT